MAESPRRGLPPRASHGATLAIVALFLTNGLANGSLLPFAPAILAERGFDAAGIGLIGASVSVGTLLVAGPWAHLADVVLGRGRALAVALGIGMVLLVVFRLVQPLPAIAVAYVVFLTFYALVFPLQDALAVNALPQPDRQYGLVRGLQSGMFALAASGFGLLWAVTGYGAAVPAMLVLALPVVIAALRVPDVARAKLSEGHGRGGAIREALRVAPRLPRILLAIGLAHVGVFGTLTFLPLLILHLGGGSGQIGLAAAVTAAVEVAALPLAGRLMGRVGPRLVMGTGVAVIAVVYAWFALAPSAEHVIAASVLYGVGWSGMWAGSVATVRGLLPAPLQGSGQTLVSLTTGGVAALLANVGGGLLWDGAGSAVVFGLFGLLAMLGAVVAWTSVPNRLAPPVLA